MSRKARIVGQVIIKAEHCRYAISVMRTRFGTVECFILDAEGAGAPECVFQGDIERTYDWFEAIEVHLSGVERAKTDLLVVEAEKVD